MRDRPTVRCACLYACCPLRYREPPAGILVDWRSQSCSRRGRGLELDDDVVGGQQKQSPEEGIPEGGPIPLHRDTTIIYVFFINTPRAPIVSQSQHQHSQHSPHSPDQRQPTAYRLPPQSSASSPKRAAVLRRYPPPLLGPARPRVLAHSF